jgi:hypothetical protein
LPLMRRNLTIAHQLRLPRAIPAKTSPHHQR